MKRRSILKWIAMAATLPVIPRLSAGSLFSVLRKVSGKRAALSPETDALGRLYLSACPEDIDACRALLGRIGCSPSSPLVLDGSYRTIISRQIRDDFSTNNVVVLNGWVLSRTELRLSTLNILSA